MGRSPDAGRGLSLLNGLGLNFLGPNFFGGNLSPVPNFFGGNFPPPARKLGRPVPGLSSPLDVRSLVRGLLSLRGGRSPAAPRSPKGLLKGRFSKGLLVNGRRSPPAPSALRG